eukprot:gene32210-16767_t
MPLLNKLPFTPPAAQKCDAGTDYYVLRATGEVTKSYDEYLQRIRFYRTKQWTCAYTLKSGLTYEEALQEEARISALLPKFPREFLSSCLAAVHHSTMTSDEIVTHLYDLHKPGPAGKENGPDSPPTIPKRPPFTKPLLRRWLVEVADKKGQLWVVKTELASKVGLALEVPEKLKDAMAVVGSPICAPGKTKVVAADSKTPKTAKDSAPRSLEEEERRLRVGGAKHFVFVQLKEAGVGGRTVDELLEASVKLDPKPDWVENARRNIYQAGVITDSKTPKSAKDSAPRSLEEEERRLRVGGAKHFVFTQLKEAGVGGRNLDELLAASGKLDPKPDWVENARRNMYQPETRYALRALPGVIALPDEPKKPSQASTKETKPTGVDSASKAGELAPAGAAGVPLAKAPPGPPPAPLDPLSEAEGSLSKAKDNLERCQKVAEQYREKVEEKDKAIAQLRVTASPAPKIGSPKLSVTSPVGGLASQALTMFALPPELLEYKGAEDNRKELMAWKKLREEAIKKLERKKCRQKRAKADAKGSDSKEKKEKSMQKLGLEVEDLKRRYGIAVKAAGDAERIVDSLEVEDLKRRYGIAVKAAGAAERIVDREQQRVHLLKDKVDREAARIAEKDERVRRKAKALAAKRYPIDDMELLEELVEKATEAGYKGPKPTVDVLPADVLKPLMLEPDMSEALANSLYFADALSQFGKALDVHKGTLTVAELETILQLVSTQEPSSAESAGTATISTTSSFLPQATSDMSVGVATDLLWSLYERLLGFVLEDLGALEVIGRIQSRWEDALHTCTWPEVLRRYIMSRAGASENEAITMVPLPVAVAASKLGKGEVTTLTKQEHTQLLRFLMDELLDSEALRGEAAEKGEALPTPPPAADGSDDSEEEEEPTFELPPEMVVFSGKSCILPCFIMACHVQALQIDESSSWGDDSEEEEEELTFELRPEVVVFSVGGDDSEEEEEEEPTFELPPEMGVFSGKSEEYSHVFLNGTAANMNHSEYACMHSKKMNKAVVGDESDEEEEPVFEPVPELVELVPKLVELVPKLVELVPKLVELVPKLCVVEPKGTVERLKLEKRKAKERDRRAKEKLKLDDGAKERDRRAKEKLKLDDGAKERNRRAKEKLKLDDGAKERDRRAKEKPKLEDGVAALQDALEKELDKLAQRRAKERDRRAKEKLKLEDGVTALQDALEKELDKLAQRRAPLGSDRHHRRYWWGLAGQRSSLLVEDAEGRWLCIDTLAQVDELMAGLDTRGVRERDLKRALDSIYPDLAKAFTKATQQREAAKKLQPGDSSAADAHKAEKLKGMPLERIQPSRRGRSEVSMAEEDLKKRAEEKRLEEKKKARGGAGGGGGEESTATPSEQILQHGAECIDSVAALASSARLKAPEGGWRVWRDQLVECIEEEKAEGTTLDVPKCLEKVRTHVDLEQRLVRTHVIDLEQRLVRWSGEDELLYGKRSDEGEEVSEGEEGMPKEEGSGEESEGEEEEGEEEMKEEDKDVNMEDAGTPEENGKSLKRKMKVVKAKVDRERDDMDKRRRLAHHHGHQNPQGTSTVFDVLVDDAEEEVYDSDDEDNEEDAQKVGKADDGCGQEMEPAFAVPPPPSMPVELAGGGRVSKKKAASCLWRTRKERDSWLECTAKACTTSRLAYCCAVLLHVSRDPITASMKSKKKGKK